MSEVTLRDGEHGPVLENGLVRVSLHLNRGTFDVAALEAGRGSLTGAAASVALDGEPSLTTRGAGLSLEREEGVDDALGRGIGIVLARETDEGEPECMLTLTLRDGQGFATAGVELVNGTMSPIKVSAFRVVDEGRVDLGASPHDWRFYKGGGRTGRPRWCCPYRVRMSRCRRR